MEKITFNLDHYWKKPLVLGFCLYLNKLHHVFGISMNKTQSGYFYVTNSHPKVACLKYSDKLIKFSQENESIFQQITI